MTMIRMYVSHPFIMGSPEAIALVGTIEADIAKHFGGFTITQGRGAWVDPDGVTRNDVVDVYDIMVDDHTSYLIMDEFAKRFAKAYDQEWIPYAIMGSENHFMNREE